MSNDGRYGFILCGIEMTGRDMTVLGGACVPSAVAGKIAAFGVGTYAGVECGVSGMCR